MRRPRWSLDGSGSVSTEEGKLEWCQSVAWACRKGVTFSYNSFLIAEAIRISKSPHKAWRMGNDPALLGVRIGTQSRMIVNGIRPASLRLQSLMLDGGGLCCGVDHGTVPRAGEGVAEGGPPHPRPVRRRDGHCVPGVPPGHRPIRSRARGVRRGFQLLPHELDQAQLPVDDVPLRVGHQGEPGGHARPARSGDRRRDLYGIKLDDSPVPLPYGLKHNPISI